MTTYPNLPCSIRYPTLPYPTLPCPTLTYPVYPALSCPQPLPSALPCPQPLPSALPWPVSFTLLPSCFVLQSTVPCHLTCPSPYSVPCHVLCPALPFALPFTLLCAIPFALLCYSSSSCSVRQSLCVSSLSAPILPYIAFHSASFMQPP